MAAIISLMTYFVCILFSAGIMTGIVFLVIFLISRNNANFFTDGYISMGIHILLLLVTCGVWTYVWIYKLTGYLNNIPGEENRTPVYQLLLCMFVPYYYIYWVYVSAQRIDKKALTVGVSSDITIVSLILVIFVPVVAYIIMQDKINKICDLQKNNTFY